MDENGTSAPLPAGFSSGDIAGAIAKLREHPEIISAVAGALSGGASSNSSETDERSDSKPSENKALSNIPENVPIEKITEAMTVIAPILSEFGSKPSHDKEIKGNPEDHRHALLHALRPYLSHDRREMVDYILKFGRISELLKKIK